MILGTNIVTAFTAEWIQWDAVISAGLYEKLAVAAHISGAISVSV
jgi:hypothetical protein